VRQRPNSVGIPLAEMPHRRRRRGPTHGVSLAVADTVLPRLTAEDLKDLGAGFVEDRHKLLEAIAHLRAVTAIRRSEACCPIFSRNKLGRNYSRVGGLRQVVGDETDRGLDGGPCLLLGSPVCNR
jgi:hypothetical protein